MSLNVSQEGLDDEINENQDDEGIILCLIYKNNKLGAAFYDFGNKMLNYYDEILDSSPYFFQCRTLYRQLNPKFTLIIGGLDDDLVKVLIDVVNFDELTVNSNTIRSLPPNFSLLSLKDYSYEMCKAAILHLSLGINFMENDHANRQFIVQSIINFDNKMSTHALGALIKYLDKNWAMFGATKEDLPFLHVNEIAMKDHVLMDWSGFDALQVFVPKNHEAGFKKGLASSNREGFSVYSVFSTFCKSSLGLNALKRILLNPINNINELNKRLDFIELALNHSNSDFIESLEENIKKLSDIHMTLSKIQNSKATSRDWKILYKTIYHAVYINELAAPFRQKCPLLEDLNNEISIDLLRLETSIDAALDFNTKETCRQRIKFGLDKDLDAKQLRLKDMMKHVTAAAELIVEKLPSYLNECAIVYLPEMGHLITIKEWDRECNLDDLQLLNFEHMFTLRGVLHFKHPICKELDECLGNLNASIIAHENRILQRLSGFVLKYHKDIRAPLEVLGLMDCLLSIAKVARHNNYIRPHLNHHGIQEIQEGRHILMELASHFEKNDFYSGGPYYSRIKIVTGPNGSGKSVYLKQIALNVYLAHVGCYIPAKMANIGMVHSIHTRIQATESASVHLSAFMLDIIQATQAIHNATSTSLVLLDEFGRGTTGDEGVALLVGILKANMKLGKFCPHILVSTHFQQVTQRLPECPMVEHLAMDHRIIDNDSLTFLYKVKKGVSNTCALDVAASIGIDNDIIKRAKEYLNHFKNGTKIRPLKKLAAVDVKSVCVPKLDEDEDED